MSDLTNEELTALPMGSVFVYDVECYPNYFIVGFKLIGTDKYLTIRAGEPNWVAKLRWVVKRFTLISFNGRNYDGMMLDAACSGDCDAAAMYGVSLAIIREGVNRQTFMARFGFPRQDIEHIDIDPVCPLQASLKMYGARLHCKTIADLPYNPHQELTEPQMDEVYQYNRNDLDVTELVVMSLKGELTLRKDIGIRYNRDVMSKSDAQIAEAVIGAECGNLLNRRITPPVLPEGYTFRYEPPAYLKQAGPIVSKLVELISTVNYTLAESGAPELPEAVKGHKVYIGAATYQIGNGGLHSCEKTQAIVAGPNESLIDRDVASYYPQIILNQRLYPEHIGPVFLDVYGSIVDRRLAAKKAGNKTEADSLKIVINGSFGKLGSKYSILYAPRFLIQVTMTGQLSLLMLIEWVESIGVQVVSANTDGVVMRCPQDKEARLRGVVKAWESVTKFETEETRYSAVYSRDVNNYIAVKTDGKVKLKGTYSNPWGDYGVNSIFKFHKNPDATICTDAVVAFLTKGTPIETTINECQDIRAFAIVYKVSGGAILHDQFVGKTLRWYYGKGSHIITDKEGRKVPDSDGAELIQTLPDVMPDNVNRQKYIDIATSILYDLGRYTRDRQIALAL